MPCAPTDGRDEKGAPTPSPNAAAREQVRLVWHVIGVVAAVAAPAVGAQYGGSVNALTVVVGDGGPVVRRAAEVFARDVGERSGVNVRIATGPAPGPSIVLSVDPDAGLGEDGLSIQVFPHGGTVVGVTPSGLVAGVGKLLRLMRFGDHAVYIPQADLRDAPKLPVRGIYFATHFGNFYHVAPLAEVDRIIEEFALWGGNQLCVWFDMHHFQGTDDPAAQEHLARLRHFSDTAHAVGMKFGLTFIANEAYDSSPPELRADPNTGTAHYQRELCPSKPGALELIGKWQGEVLDSFPEVDFAWTWPYDQGGCACPDCAPWGANGYLKASEQLARLFHKRRPEAPLWLSTWLLDQVNAKGEYEGLFRYIREREPEWFQGMIVGTHGDWVPQPLLERPFPDRYPLASFPEISMYRMNPWGCHGANPLPDFCSRLAGKLKGITVGGWPYSEGIYEDLNKFYWARYYWDPDVDTEDVLREYAAHYLSPDAADDAVRMFHLMEKTHARNGWQVANLEGADEEWRLARSIDGKLAAWARASWRWRILYIRAAIDGILAAEGLSTEAIEKLRPLCDELGAIYHASGTFIGPPPLPRAPDPGNLAYRKPVTVSSSAPGYEDRTPQLVDGVLSDVDGENFWCSDKDKEATATVVVDLGASVSIGEVRLQFRGLYGVFWFLPESTGFDVSDEGETWTAALDTRDVPHEGDAYLGDLRRYSIGKPGRYVRVRLGPSQHRGDRWAGCIELTEIEVYAR